MLVISLPTIGFVLLYAVDFVLSFATFAYLMVLKLPIAFGEHAHAHPHVPHEYPSWSGNLYMNLMVIGLAFNFTAAALTLGLWAHRRYYAPSTRRRLLRALHLLFFPLGALGVGAAAALLLPVKLMLDDDGYPCLPNGTDAAHTQRVNHFVTDAQFAIFTTLTILVLLLKFTQLAITVTAAAAAR